MTATLLAMAVVVGPVVADAPASSVSLRPSAGRAGLLRPTAGLAGLTQRAEQAYLAHDYAAASRGYAAAVAAGGESADLEYDLGTAAAQSGDLGQAALHLERSLKLFPWDGDARRNLERVREKRVDKVVGQDIGDSPLQRLLKGLPVAPLSWAFAALWFLAFVLIALRRCGLGATCAAVALACGGLAWASGRAQARPFGIVVAKVADVRSGPGADRPSSFEIHEGLEVLIEDQESSYVRVRLANGLEGWVPLSEVERI